MVVFVLTPSKVTVPELCVNVGDPDLVKLPEIVNAPDALGAVKIPAEITKSPLTSNVTAPEVKVPAAMVKVAVTMLTLWVMTPV